jgi:hypothetical protein
VYRNSLVTSTISRPTIKFTMEIDTNSATPFLDVLIIREGSTLFTKFYRKPTHTGLLLHCQSNHPPHVKRGVVQSLYHRGTTIFQEQEVRSGEIILKLFKTGHGLRNSLMRTRPISATQETANCIYNIPYECDRSYIGETGRQRATRLREHSKKFGSRSSGKIQTSTTFVRRESPYTLERSEDFRDKRFQCTGSARKRPVWHVYKILSAGPASKLLPSGTLHLGMKFLDITVHRMKVPNFCTVGVSGV